jgi:hypothetical protein
MNDRDEFYIGYEPSMPPGLAGRVRAAVVVVCLLLISVAVVLVVVQRPLAGGSFDYGRRQTWTGLLVRTPAPAILVPTRHGYGRFWLVGRGKHGADAALGPVSEGWVQVIGTLISRDPWRMVEVVSVSRVPAPERTTAVAPEPDTLGRDVTLRGEIVDSKCFLGVMNPGERVVHRDCAVRCLSGGVPPMLAYRDDHGRTDVAVLVDAHGRLLHEAVHDAVGRPVRARGRLFRVNGQPVFQLASIAGGAP